MSKWGKISEALFFFFSNWIHLHFLNFHKCLKLENAFLATYEICMIPFKDYCLYGMAIKRYISNLCNKLCYLSLAWSLSDTFKNCQSIMQRLVEFITCFHKSWIYKSWIYYLPLILKTNLNKLNKHWVWWNKFRIRRFKIRETCDEEVKVENTRKLSVMSSKSLNH